VASSPVDTKTLCYSVMNDAQKLRFEEDLEIDFSFGIRGMARFRANVYMQQACVAGAFRIVPYAVIPLEDLGLPTVVKELCDKPRGLVLVTGPTGSGKSTTLASMIDRINTNTRGHIVTSKIRSSSSTAQVVSSISARLARQPVVQARSIILRQTPTSCSSVRCGPRRSRPPAVAETGHPGFARCTPTGDPEHQPHRHVFPSHQQADPRGAVVRARRRGHADADLKVAGPQCCRRGHGAERCDPEPDPRDKLHQIYCRCRSVRRSTGCRR
jgi:twitching motility protein PilT